MKDKIKRIIVKNYRWMIIFIGLILFLVILEYILDYEIKNFDVWGYNVVARSISDYMTPIAKIITKFGNAESLILITIISCFVVKGKKNKWAIPINLACVATLNLTLKNIIQRPRPPLEFRMVEESSFSFPSGHAMASMAFYGLIIYFINKNMKNNKLKKVICIILSILIFLIGMSRIYLGVHYASDVIAGFAISIVYLVLYITYIIKIME